MIHIIVTSYNEPKATLRAVKSLLNQNIKEEYKIIVVDPFPEIEKFLQFTGFDYTKQVVK